MKLISMTDFVSQKLETGCAVTQLQLLHRYKDFLKQPLTLGMFIPVDDDGSVVSNVVTDINYFGIHVYEKAKEKVLFKDDIFFIRNCGKYGISVEIYKAKEYVYNSKGRNDNLIVEDLIKYDLELTPSALKQIGLNP